MAEHKDKAKRPFLLRWGVSIILIVWAFILGILVGQGILVNDQQLASLRKLSLSWFGVSNNQPPEAGQNPLRDPELSFYDQLADKGNVALPPTTTPPPGQQTVNNPTPPQPATTSPATTYQPDTGYQPATGQPTSHIEPPATGATHTPTPLNQVRPYQPDSVTATSSPPPAVNNHAPQATAGKPGGRFTIQVGSFQQEKQANDLAGKLKSNGFPAYVSRIQIENVGTRFRVRVGGYENLEQAQNIATSLRVKENIAAYVTRND